MSLTHMFRLYDDATDGVTIEQATEEGWECTAIDGKWCRKPFLNRIVHQFSFRTSYFRFS